MKIDPKADSTARRIHQRGKMQKASFLGGRKVSGMIQTESRLEASAVFVAELDPRVAQLSPQPFTIDLSTGRVWERKSDLLERYKGSRHKPRVYTPDFKLLLTSGVTLLLETKHSRLLRDNPDAQLLPDVLARLGLPLLIATDSDLWGPVDHNARLLWPYVGHAPDADRSGRLTALFSEPHEVGLAFSELGLTQRDVLGAIASGHLACDLLSRRLGPQTLVRTSGGDRSYLELLPL